MTTAGRCYLDGYGTEKDMEEAVKWLRMAAGNGDAEASELLKELKSA
jgi:TPR repeat protein